MVRCLGALAALSILPGCVTERTKRPPVIVDPSPAEPAAAPRSPVATPASSARSTSTAARIAIRPLGLVPYDGLVLPLISPDGRWLAAQTGAAPTWDQLLGRSADAPIGTRIEIYSLSNSDVAQVALPAQEAESTMLGHTADAKGFAIRRADSQLALPYHTWAAIPEPIALAALPGWFEREVDVSDLARYQARTGASASAIGVLVFSASRGRMIIATDAPHTSVLLAPGSIAGCWVLGAGGEPSGALVTTSEGLMLQRLVHDGSMWRAEAPVRLLRDPWVPRATSDPQKPFILIGPGPRNRPEMLQITAMTLVE